MIESLLVHIRALAVEALAADAFETDARYQCIEHTLNQIIAQREPECEHAIPPANARAVRALMLSESETVSIVKGLRWVLSMASRYDDHIVVYPPSRKSVYAMYEKFIDRRMSRSGGVTCSEKRERNLQFKQLIAELSRRGHLHAIPYDIVRARLVASTPTSFQRLFAALPAHITTAGFVAAETKMIGVTEEDGVIRFPYALAVPEYIAVHCKMIALGNAQLRAELQLRIAPNHWGPHALRTANGYLNKYLAPTAECVDYAINRIGVGLGP